MSDIGGDQTGGRVLGLDLGEKRIGVAVSDATRLLARSLIVLKRTSRRADFEAIGRLIAEQGASLVVVGLPTLPSGEEGSKAAWARDYAEHLGRSLLVDVVLWDESFSTVDAQASLRARSRSGKTRGAEKAGIDAVAAAFILQSYLDAQNDAGRPFDVPGRSIQR